MKEQIHMVTRVAPEAGEPRLARDEPFRVLLVGDFTGRGSRGVRDPLAERRPRRVDRDDLPGVFEALAPELELSTRAAGGAHRLRLRSLDDLHPDRLWESLSVFGELRSLRRRLSNPETFADAAAEMGVSLPDSSAPAPPAPVPDSLPGNLLDEAVRETEAGSSAGTGSELVDAILQELVIPRIPPTPGQADLVSSVDAAAAEEMRALLHAPELRRLESNWRAAELVVRRLDTDSKLQVWLLDVTADELVRDVLGNEEPTGTEVWKAVFEPDAEGGTARWAMCLALDLTFGPSLGQAALLARLARLAAVARAPLLAAASEGLAGCPSLAEHPDPDDWQPPDDEAAAAWTALRQRPEAAWILLALPRILLRAPYGARTNPLERFEFEELSSPPAHEEFLWGSGALAPVLFLGTEFSRRGWDLELAQVFELDRMPVPVVPDAEGELDAKPCSEVVLSERAASELRSLGLAPLCTVRDTDRIRFGPVTSVAGAPLSGRWSS